LIDGGVADAQDLGDRLTNDLRGRVHRSRRLSGSG
jgi:hypothetical protein